MFSARSILLNCWFACRAAVGLAGLLVFNAVANPITTENSLPGNPPSEWDVSGSGDDTIQGFATSISVNKGETIQFKIKTTATSYQIRIYRLGYYNGNGARFITNFLPSVSLPQSQPNPIVDNFTGLIDCGNWAVSASWTVPTNLCSGLYIARPTRSDNQGASHILFVVRDDNGGADLLFQTSDTTWNAYNTYGGNSLYGMYHTLGFPTANASRAYKVSYNRPLTTRGTLAYYSLWTGEIPMIRWLEANGYNMSYISGVDTDRYPNQLTNNHKVFMSVGHDEYWSATQRTNVTQARNAGLNLAFFSGNEMFWKVRWEPSIDGSATPRRTLVCYKETSAGAKIDPSPAWTGTWRDPRFSPPSDGGFPENEITGTMFIVNGIALNELEVPADYGKHRFWRNTSVATLSSGQKAVFPTGTLGFEWDMIPDNGFQPPGQMRLSLTTVNGVSVLQDYGTSYSSGQATHNLSLYRHQSGALVFGAGSVHWSWGLDDTHSNSQGPSADIRIQQATVNLFADMGAQPGSIRPGLVAASASTDFTAPASTITSPATNSSYLVGSSIQINGTATDSGGGKPWLVEVSTDNGVSWKTASGKTNWTYSWAPQNAGAYVLKSRAVDDSGNFETPTAGISVSITNPPYYPGTIGYTNDGPSLDNAHADINANRFLAASNMVVSTIYAKIVGVTGHYKCAIYSDVAGQPNALIQKTMEVTNPSTGWAVFQLDSPVYLSNTNYYWLAIWSDSASAQVYCSNGSGTFRYGQYPYGNWPSTISTASGSATTYSIYAIGKAALSFQTTPTNRTVPELTQLVVTNKATNTDMPAMPLTYQLASPPSGATISTNGVISWMPTEAQGPSTNALVTIVSDGVSTISNSFQVIVTEVNQAPTFTSTPTNRTIPEMTLMTVTNSATDADLPPQVLSYQLVNPPAGATIGTNGVITWTPSGSQGPSTNNFETVVGDGFVTITNSFQVTVIDSNVAPTAISQSLTNAEDSPLVIMLSSIDPDGPMTNYVVVTNPVHGVLTGTAPLLTYQPNTNFFGLDSLAFRVNDGFLTSAVATISILITNINDAPELPAQSDLYTGVFQTVTVSNQATDVDSPANSLSYTLLSATDATISTNGVIIWKPKFGPGTNAMTTIVQDSGAPVLSATNTFYVIVTNSVVPPVIQSLEAVGTNAILTWSAMSNGVYRVQYQDVVGSTNWVGIAPDITASGPTATATNLINGQTIRLYRILVVP